MAPHCVRCPPRGRVRTLGRPGGTDMDTQEPKDGDFIAYIEQLQKESAARLLGAHHAVNQLEKSPAKGAAKSDSHFFAGRKPADLRSAAELQAALARVAAPMALAPLIIPALPIAVGAVVGLYWLLAGSGPALFLLAIGLVIWGMKRVLNALPPQRATQALVSSVFTTPVKPK